MDFQAYRSSDTEQLRTEDLFKLLPRGRKTILEIGARDGHHTRRLTTLFDSVTALDLTAPAFDIPSVIPVQGDVTQLDFPDGSFDCVLCAEVLEHVPAVERAAKEIARVARHEILIGVPYRQDTRVGRLYCSFCSTNNPPYGHINTFDEGRLQQLFQDWRASTTHYVGTSRDRTNAISALLMDFARNPWGSYGQEEGCIHCGAKMIAPAPRSLTQRVATAVAHRLNVLQQQFEKPRANWIHILFSKASQ